MRAVVDRACTAVRAAAPCAVVLVRFVLALTLAVGLGQQEGLLLSFGAAALPAAVSVPALLAACAMVWQSGEAAGRYSLRACRAPFVMCLLLAAAGALLRVAFAALWQV